MRFAFLIPLLLLSATPARAQDSTAAMPAAPASQSPRKLQLEAYAAINYANYNWQTDPKRRSTIDLERLVLEAVYQATPRLSFEAEVEFEHGGTGVTMEFDPFEEFGEFETEIEKGGEVIVEELHLTYALNDWLSLRAGHFYVPIGYMSSKYTPREYLTVLRPEMELALLPAQWDETGVKLMATKGKLRAQIGGVNGLDNSEFSSATWIRRGKQRRFEQVRMENIAGFARADFLPVRGVTVGVAGYFGNTTGNRPKSDLTRPAYVSIFDGHADLERDGWRIRGQYIHGWLQNSDLVSAANRNLSNQLNAKRTPVAAQAEGWSVEAGYDVLRLLHGRPASAISPGLDFFGRYEWYDSMHRTVGDVFDNPRWERKQWTIGLNWRMNQYLTLKAEYADRTVGIPSNNHERTIASGLGAQF